MPISNYPDQLWLRLFNADFGGFPTILTLAKAEAERGLSDSVGFGAMVKVIGLLVLNFLLLIHLGKLFW
jgi:hypothetical protein